MALAALCTVSCGSSSLPVGRLVACGNSGSSSYASAARGRVLLDSRGFATLAGGRDLWRRSFRKRRDKSAVFAAADEGNDAAGGDGRSPSSSSSSEADVQALESRLGLGRRARRDAGEPSKSRSPAPPPTPQKREKKWEEMSLAEQAWSLYIGEKGFLFWLNKLAYAAIFIVIGGWIVFRFIGPALGWYNLDSPLLPPDQLLG